MAASLGIPMAGAARRTRVLRSAPDQMPWELWQREPPPELGDFVAGLWAGVSAHAFACHRTLPNGELVLMLHLGPGQQLVERNGAPCDELRPGPPLPGLPRSRDDDPSRLPGRPR